MTPDDARQSSKGFGKVPVLSHTGVLVDLRILITPFGLLMFFGLTR